MTKCCPQNQILNQEYNTCINNPENSQSNIGSWIPSRMILSPNSGLPTGHFNIDVSNFPDICDFSAVPPESFFIDGSFVFFNYSTASFLKVNYECLDKVHTEGSQVTGVAVLVCTDVLDYDYDHSIDDQDLLRRFGIGENIDGFTLYNSFHNFSEDEYVGIYDLNDTCEWGTIRTVYSAIGSISLCCLLISLYILIVIGEYVKMHGVNVIANIITTSMVHVWFLSVYYSGATGGSVGCIFLGYFGYFSTFTMFSWMTVMSMDLAWTFYKAKLHTKLHRRTIVLYSSMGFGAPLFLTVFAGICQV